MSSFKRFILLVSAFMLLSCPVHAITLQEARDAVLANDPEAADASKYWMYQSSETDGMWVIYAYGYDNSTAHFSGGAWFVSPEKSVSLGYTKSLLNWGFYSSAEQPPVPDDQQAKSGAAIWPAFYVAQGPEFMVSNTDRMNAWMLDPMTLLPQKVDTGKLTSINSENGFLQGTVEEHGLDYAFLRIKGDSFVQIAAAPIEESVVRSFPDGSMLLDQLIAQGYTFKGFLYRAGDPDSVGTLKDLQTAECSIAVNLEKDGQPWHTYFYYIPGDALNYIDGTDWGGDGELWITVFDGKASERLDAGLEIEETLLQ